MCCNWQYGFIIFFLCACFCWGGGGGGDLLFIDRVLLSVTGSQDFLEDMTLMEDRVTGGQAIADQ